MWQCIYQWLSFVYSPCLCVLDRCSKALDGWLFSSAITKRKYLEIIIQCRVRIWIYSGESEFNHLNFCTHTCKNSRTQSACNMLTRATYNSGSIFAHSIFNLHLSAKGDETAHNALYWSTLLCVTVAVLNFPFLRFRCHYYLAPFFSIRRTWVPASFVSLLPTIRFVVHCAYTRKQTCNCHIKITFKIEFVANGHFFQWDIKIIRLTRNNKYFFPY